MQWQSLNHFHLLPQIFGINSQVIFHPEQVVRSEIFISQRFQFVSCLYEGLVVAHWVAVAPPAVQVCSFNPFATCICTTVYQDTLVAKGLMSLWVQDYISEFWNNKLYGFNFGIIWWRMIYSQMWSFSSLVFFLMVFFLMVFFLMVFFLIGLLPHGLLPYGLLPGILSSMSEICKFSGLFANFAIFSFWF